MSIKQTWARWAKDGIQWPLMRDPVDGKPSITVMFAYLTFALATTSVIALHFFPGILAATGVTCGFWAMATVFYMLRKITKAKFDADDRSFELDGETPAPTTTTTTTTTTTPSPSGDDNVGS